MPRHPVHPAGLRLPPPAVRREHASQADQRAVAAGAGHAPAKVSTRFLNLSYSYN